MSPTRVVGVGLCLLLVCLGVLFGLASLTDDTEDIESAFHPDFHVAQQGAKQHPHDNGYRLQYAFALYDKKRYSEAMKQLSPMLKEEKPKPDDVTQAIAFLYAGKILNAMGKPEQARKPLQSLLAVCPPDDPEVTISMRISAQKELDSTK